MKLLGPGARILVSRLVQVAANAGVVLLIASRLGPAGQGHYSLTVALGLLLASFLAGGQGLAAVPHLGTGGIHPRRLLRAQVLWGAGGMAVAAGLAWLSLLPGPAAFLASHLGWRPGLGFLVALAVTGIMLFEIFSYDLLGCGRLVVGAVINGARAGGHMLLVALAAAAGLLSLTWAVGLVALAQVAGGLAAVTIAARALSRRLPSGADDESGGSDLAPGRLALRLAREGWVGQLSAVAYFLLLRLDQALLEHFRGAAEVGVYSVAVYFGELLWLLPGALTPLLVHRAAMPQEKGRHGDSLRAVRLGLAVTFLAGSVLYFLAGPLLPLLAGGAYAQSAAALRALLPGIVAFAPGAVLAGDFIGRGKPHWNTQASLLTLGLNVAFCLWLIPGRGAVGAGWASSLAYTCGSIYMLVRFLRASGYGAGALLRGH